jgi:hypothetical protein
VEFLFLLAIIAMFAEMRYAMRFSGMHRVSNKAFLDLLAAAPDSRVLAKPAGTFGKAHHYILLADGARIYTRADAPIGLPESVVIIESFIEAK